MSPAKRLHNFYFFILIFNFPPPAGDALPNPTLKIKIPQSVKLKIRRSFAFFEALAKEKAKEDQKTCPAQKP